MPQSIVAPSGVVFEGADIHLIKDLGEIGFIKYNEKPFTLKSKVLSHIYVFGREELTSNLPVLWKIGRKICETVRTRMNEENDRRKPAYIGLPTAGTPLAQMAATVDFANAITGRDSTFYQMRSVKKQSHGAHETWIIGKPDVFKERIFRIDNVVTDGATKFEMADRFAEDGLPTMELDDIILVDRQQGAIKRMMEKGYKKPIVMFNLLDLAYVFEKLEIWPGSIVAKVEREIADHQF